MRKKTDKIGGELIVPMPARNVNTVYVKFSTDEREFYKCLESRTAKIVNKYLEEGTAISIEHAFSLLLRLRQTCVHPQIVTNSKAIRKEKESVASFRDDNVKNARSIPREAVGRSLKNGALGNALCTICMKRAVEPVIVHNCGYIYCRSCISGILSTFENLLIMISPSTHPWILSYL
ncbi:hypothetical protein BC936DRAFT_139165 [Jimgerdemannia flammicorona]|uniref:Zinc finger RING-type eukaryotic domain-containing protein n=1 Tax=Jimgerdemannia flammicorona TaxID=994334 RepID=A0A433BAJ2_9FUNG|nr:hypothetical protein BC936DRAFT_139165 [Jimgerdemannia flammicorona]